MEDDAGGDEKLITVPVDTTFPYYSEIAGHGDLPPIVTQQIEHFFTHYKDLEPGKWPRSMAGAASTMPKGSSPNALRAQRLWGFSRVYAARPSNCIRASCE